MSLRGPHSSYEVPEWHGLAVSDEVGFTIYGGWRLLHVDGHGEEFFGRQDVCVGGVDNVGKVGKIGVVAELEFSLAALEGLDHPREGLSVSGPEGEVRLEISEEKKVREEAYPKSPDNLRETVSMPLFRFASRTIFSPIAYV